jgi:hypothetical protein
VVEKVHATDDRSDEYGRGGLWVQVRHDGATVPGLGESFQVAYLHMSQLYVSHGDRVDTSSVLGLSGATGGVGPHLHLHVSRDGRFCSAPVDPGCPDRIEGSVIPGFYDAPGCQSACEPVPVLWVQPARYGGEPWEGGGPAPDPCEGLDYAGRCDGDVISWCEDGLQVVDCAATGRVCAWHNDEVGHNCLDCARLGPPKCDGARHLSCASGALVATRCDELGQRCEPTGCVSDAPPDAGGDEVEDAPTDAPADVLADAPTDAPADAPTDALTDAPAVEDAPTDAPRGEEEGTPRARTKEGCQQGGTGWGASPWAWWGAWGRRRSR